MAARWIERALLRGFTPAEIEEITSDLGELARDRGGIRGAIYYWIALLEYPLRQLMDRLRHTGFSRTESREGRWGGMDALWKDARYALRSLRRDPAFTIMAVAIITVSMGATAAIFAVVDGVLLEPLPVEEPDRLVSLWLESDQGRRGRMTPGNFVDIAGVEDAFVGVAAFSGQTASLSLGDEPVFLRGSRVTPGYFETLGVQPVLGRGFTADEGEAGGPPVVVLAHHLWEQLFASDPAVTRRSIRLDGADYDVVGVAPPGVYPTQATVSAEIPFTAANQDFFVPLRYSPAGWANRRSHLLGMIGRLAPGVPPETARARLASLSESLRATEPLNANERILMTSFSEEVVGDVRFGLLTLLGTVGLVLTIAVVNVGALFVLRADDRRPELAIRVAMGAPTGRLVRQMLLESLLIVGVASAGAVFVARAALGAMRGLVPYQIPRLAEVQVGAAVLLVTIAIGLVVATAFALAPALAFVRRRPDGSPGRARGTAGPGQRRLQSAVVGLQAALCMVVLVGAALLGRSYSALRAVDPGFSAMDAWAMSVPASRESLEEIVLGVRELPGVAAAAIAYDHPLSRSWGDGFAIEGREPSDSDPRMSTSLRPFGEGYFEAVDIDVIEGRVPDAVDLSGEVAYAVVNETFARIFFPDGPAPGSRIVLPTAQRMLGTDGLFEILGVVSDVRFLGPDQEPGPALYVPLSHFPVDATILLVRPERPELAVVPGVRGVVTAIEPGMGVQRAQRMRDLLDDELARPRFNMMLLVSFAALGLILCGLGAYGLMGRVVAMRVREIGIQMALGADRGRLARAVVGSAMRPLVAGGVIGAFAALWLGRVIHSLLFAVSPSDPASFLASALFVLGVGAAAAVLPTGRAVSIDPAAALRSD